MSALDRRRFLHAGLAFTAAACSGEVTVSLPESSDSSGSALPGAIGSLDELRAQVAAEEFVGLVKFDAWLVAYPSDRVEAAKAVYPEELHQSLEMGLLALRWKCTHLGCRVPECRTSGQFECPCHGSVYSGVGEYRNGPAPRGLDLLALQLDGDQVVIGGVVRGLERDIDVSGTTPRGPMCISLPDESG